MIKAKPYLTLEGCASRCRFETAYSKTSNYHTIRFLDGVRDAGDYVTAYCVAKRYTWRIEKVSRKAKKA